MKPCRSPAGCRRCHQEDFPKITGPTGYVEGAYQLRGHPRPTTPKWQQAGSWGVGDLIRAAVEKGAARIIIGLGGSATTDAGFGMAQALGAEFVAADGTLITKVCDIGSVASVCLDNVDVRLSAVKFVIASDVRNPLTGTQGAAEVYGPQKGLDESDVVEVDAAIEKFAEVVEQEVGEAGLADQPGAGAAGGLGFMAAALLKAEVRSGVDLVLDETSGERWLELADLLITGEGRIDAQTLSGKAPAGVAERARARQIPVVAVCGQHQLDGTSSSDIFDAIYSLTEYEADVNECIRNPLPILKRIGQDISVRHLA
ncbi:glycerate kinase [Corynebacterium lubricantis]|uniref:glycerate kinase n=1 Tax=Corynebacterium lubricantis TaxID=541095 RepID=UPI0003A7FCC3|nr:glycerate kinase [Corynebacterium lubricantis]